MSKRVKRSTIMTRSLRRQNEEQMSTANERADSPDSSIIDLENLPVRDENSEKEIVDLTKGYGPLLVDLTEDEEIEPQIPRIIPDHELPVSLETEVVATEPTLSSPSPTKNQSSPTKTISCPVCLDDTEQILRRKRQLVSTVCGHIFCNTCLQEALKAQRKCPTCRRKLTNKQFHPLYI